MVRERSGLNLEEIRDRTGVAKVDLEALEQGRLEALHVEQAAVVALSRYAELLGKDPAPYVEVVRLHWPNRGLAAGAVASIFAGETPVAHLASASRLLTRIAEQPSLVAGGSPIGLSESSRRALEQASGSTARAIAALGPAVTHARRQLAGAGGSGVATVSALGRVGPLPTLPAGESTTDDPPGPSSAKPVEDTAGPPGAPAPPAPPAPAVQEESQGAVPPERTEGPTGRGFTRFLAERLGLDKTIEDLEGPTFEPGSASGSSTPSIRAGD